MIFIYINYYIVLLLIKKFNINDKIIYIKKINKKICLIKIFHLPILNVYYS